jgi:hypothetical protein
MKRRNWILLTSALACAVLTDCGTPGPPTPPALELAKPVSDLRAARKGDKIFLAWTVPARTTDHQTVRHPGPTRVCRSIKEEIGDCKSPIAEISAKQFPVPPFDPKKGDLAPKVQASYIDTLPRDLQTQDPTAQITYAVSVLNESGRSAGLSNLVQVPSAPALPPPERFEATVKSDGVLLTWKCPTVASAADPRVTYGLRIYRHDPTKPPSSKAAAIKIGDVNFMDCAQSQFLDQTFDWEKHYGYYATVVTTVSIPGKPDTEVEGDDTPIIQTVTHDVFPPAVPTGLQAVFSGVGQKPFVDLVWSPDTEADLAGYNIFRRQEGGQSVKLNSEPVKTSAYRDTNVEAGQRYFYSVSAVDIRNNESARSDEASEQVP